MSRTLTIPRVGSLCIQEDDLKAGAVMATTSTKINVRPAVEDAFFGRGDIRFQREDARAAQTPELPEPAWIDLPEPSWVDEDMVDTQLVRIPPWNLPEGLSITQLDVEFAFVSDEFSFVVDEFPVDSLTPRQETANDIFSMVTLIIGVPALWIALLAMLG